MPTETRSTTAAWFDTNLDERLTQEAISFFSRYCHLEHEALYNHLHSVASVTFQARMALFTNTKQHQRAWDIRPYPCVGQWGFLAPKIADSPAFETVLQRAKDGDLILDFGCCMGQNLRYLVDHGAPSENMYGADIEPGFWEVGYELFQDINKFRGRYLQSDTLDGGDDAPVTSSLRQQLHGNVDVIYAGAVFHLWNIDTQFEVLKGLVKLTRRNSMIVVCQLGSVEVATKPAWREGLNPRLFHNAMSIEDLWDRVCKATDTDWKVEARIVDLDVLLPNERDRVWMDQTNRGLFFEATRVL